MASHITVPCTGQSKATLRLLSPAVKADVRCEMTDHAIFPAFVILAAATVAWLILVWRLFALMKIRTPDAYASIGQPTLFLNNSVSNNIAFLRFLLSGGYSNIGNEQIRKLCAFLRGFLWCYLVGLIGLVVALFATSATRI